MIFSRVILGEHTVETDPDYSFPVNFCQLPIQEIDVEEIIVHEKWHGRQRVRSGYDIALLRLAKPAVLYLVSQILGCAKSLKIKNFISRMMVKLMFCQFAYLGQSQIRKLAI